MTEIIQGSPEWYAARLGRITASRIADVMASGKGGGPSAMRANYMAQLVAERLTGAPTRDTFKSAAMEWGSETEAQARAAYCFHNDVNIVEVGFVEHPRIAMTGASPDGMVGEDGMVEIKAPNTATHIDTLLQNKNIPGVYLKQMHWNLACSGRKWIDYNSFDPSLPESMRLCTIRIHRDAAAITEIEAAVRAFLAELDTKVKALRAQFERAA